MDGDTKMNEYLLLKWGTLKDWNLISESSLALIKKYGELGVSYGAMSQRDTPEQKQIICDLIDGLDGTIQNDWSGEYMTKDESKKYIKDH